MMQRPLTHCTQQYAFTAMGNIAEFFFIQSVVTRICIFCHKLIFLTEKTPLQIQIILISIEVIIDIFHTLFFGLSLRLLRLFDL